MINEEYLDKRRALEKRTKNLALAIIKICSKIAINNPNQIITKQLIRSGCSIGANYREACEPESKLDFTHKLSIAKKEINETLYWLELLAEINSQLKNELRNIYQEAKELLLIFSKSISTSK